MKGRAVLVAGAASDFYSGIQKLNRGYSSLYFNVFRKSDLWRDVSEAILLFCFCKNRHFLGL